MAREVHCMPLPSIAVVQIQKRVVAAVFELGSQPHLASNRLVL